MFKTRAAFAAVLATALTLGAGVAVAHAATITVATKPPIWHAAKCTDLPGDEGNVDIPDAGPGVIYYLDFIPGPPGNYLLGLGAHEVTASPQVGYTLTGVTDWKYTVTKPACKVTPKPPVWHAATCLNPDGSVDIPATTGVFYALDYIPGPAGHYLLSVGSHTVSTAPVRGYTLTGTQFWSYTVKAVTGCHKTVTKTPVKSPVKPSLRHATRPGVVPSPRPATQPAPRVTSVSVGRSIANVFLHFKF